jgi:16S rRNA (uracil1498-N3)-methyltransferase
VRRARAGDTIELVDGAGRRATATIARITDAQTELSVGVPEDVPAAVPFVRAAIPWIKGDRMEWCIEKLVEAGADEIVVWPAARAVVHLEGERLAARIAKLAAAAQAAARQCGCAHVPGVASAVSLAAALPADGLVLVLDPSSDRTIDVGDAPRVTLVSGPEGGLAPTELDALTAHTAVGLGPRILRAETAPVLATALVRAQTRS